MTTATSRKNPEDKYQKKKRLEGSLGGQDYNVMPGLGSVMGRY